ncbi:MAG: M23 family metallopeptidase [Patescibacteria group bacterium]
MGERFEKILYGLLVVIIFLGVFVFLQIAKRQNINSDITINNSASVNLWTADISNANLNQNTNSKNSTEDYQSPLDRPSERISKKPFGIRITKTNSPVQPERFFGYHTGSDFEVFADELNSDVEVKSFCAGPLRMKTTANGYGGVIVQECDLNGQTVTVIYGHLRISTVIPEVGSNINKGDIIGLLGADKSAETDGERKHLHFGIHKGIEIDIKGYVQTKEELDNWLDPRQYIN